MHKVIKFFALLAFLLTGANVFAQEQPFSEEEQKQKMYEFIDKQIEEYEASRSSL